MCCVLITKNITLVHCKVLPVTKTDIATKQMSQHIEFWYL